MKKNLVVLGIVFCLQVTACNGAFAIARSGVSIPGANVTVINRGNGVTSATYSRPVVFMGTNVKKRPPYYKKCKKKLGYWDEVLCAQYYVPKMFAEWDEQVGG